MNSFSWFRVFVLLCFVGGLSIGLRVEAHKPITSKYTYNDDVFPIFRDKCSRCHVEAGVAPMSLMTYESAYPWAESIRAELIAAHMPPWNADAGFGELANAHTLSPRELDVVLTWATGGNPQGDREKKLPAVALKNDWVMGKPDETFALPSEFTLAADRMDDWHEFTIATGFTAPRWVRAVDLLPGTPSVVRSAIVYVKPAAAAGGAAIAPESVLTRWVPGHDPDAAAGGIGFRVPAGAELGVRVHYRKTWQFEGKPLSDRSTIGMYFARGAEAQQLLAVPVSSSGSSAADGKLTFSRAIAEDVQALALSPDEVPANVTIQVEAIRPDGTREPLIRLNTRADWGRRYWFEKPVSLPRGSRIDVVATLQDPDLLSAAFAAPTAAAAAAPPPSPIRFTLDVVPARAKAGAP